MKSHRILHTDKFKCHTCQQRFQRNNELKNKGLSVGDLISFQPDSEYEYTVDGEKLYRMFTNNITLIYDK